MGAFPGIRTLTDVVDRWADREPDRRALVDPCRAETYGELRARARRVAHALAAAGVAPGSHVGYLGHNAIEFWEVWFGAAWAGCALAPLNWRSPVAELVEVADDAELAVLVADAGLAATAAGVCARTTSPPLLVVAGDPADGATGLDYERWIDGHDDAPLGAALDPADTALLAYTSGTTGLPKGVEIPHRAFAAWFTLADEDPDDRWSADDVALMVMPNFHLAGSWVSLPALFHGGTVAIVPVFEPGAVLGAIEAHRATATCLVPTAIAALLDDPRIATADLTSLRRVLYAGSPIAAETLVRAVDRFGCDLLQFYGTTETYIISLLRPAQHDPGRPELLGSCGAPVPQVDVRVVDPGGGGATGNASAPVPDGTVGEVQVRSPLMFAGYWRRPDETAAAMDGEWYRTGDLGRRDDEGNLHLVDRLKDMIVTGGENVYATEVERALARHPEVAAAAVVGEPHARWGERVVALVVPRPDTAPTAEQLVAHCRELIAGYKVPKAVHLVGSLPTTPSGKVRKADLRAALMTAREATT